MARSSLLLLMLMGTAACGGNNATNNTKPATPNDATNIPVATDPAQRSTPVAGATKCTEPTTSTLAASPNRDKGIAAFVDDRPREAIDLLSAAVKADPRDRAAEAFRVASTAKLEESKTRASDDVTSLPRIILEPIPLAQVTRRNVEGAPQAKVHLEKASEAKNLITDNLDWETKNQLQRVTVRRGADGLPANVAPTFGREQLRNAFVHADHTVAAYTSTIVVTSEGKKPIAYDVRAAVRGPRNFEVAFGQLVGKALLVELAYNGYAKDSGGKNGYFAAFDSTTGQLLWATDPLVANSGEAVVSGGSVITGYGFTAEPDFLFVLDLATGKVDQKIPVKSGPEAIRAKDGKIFVRTYDTDYVFKSTTGVAPVPPANMFVDPRAGDAPPAPNADIRCWVKRATIGIATRDPRAIHEAAEALAPISRDRVLDELLKVEQKKLEMAGRLDLQVAPLIVVPAPPWQATPSPGAMPPPKTSPKLTKVASVKASPVRNMHPAFDPTKPFFIAPVNQGKLPEAARADIPRSYGEEHLRAIIPDERRTSSTTTAERSILVYGGRFLALIKGDVTERIFDLEGFRHPPKADPQWKEFAVQDVSYAQERDGVLYICNGGGSYAKEVFGKKGFMSAIDATTGKLLWRSAPLTCNSTFAMAGTEHIVTGYGFTAEPDFLFLLRRSDGGIAQRIPVDSGPDTITIDASNHVHVETYSNVVDLDLR